MQKAEKEDSREFAGQVPSCHEAEEEEEEEEESEEKRDYSRVIVAKSRDVFRGSNVFGKSKSDRSENTLETRRINYTQCNNGKLITPNVKNIMYNEM